MKNLLEESLPIQDLSISSYLLTSEQVKLTKTERKAGQVEFYFSPKDITEKLINEYWSDTASCSPRKLFSAQRSLKDLIFSGT